MAIAANLTEAAALSYVQGSLAWTAMTLKTKLTAFVAEVSVVFEDAEPNDRPVGNWLIPMNGLAFSMVGASVTENQFNTAVEYLFRICSAGSSAESSGLISALQALLLLTAWNSHFGT